MSNGVDGALPARWCERPLCCWYVGVFLRSFVIRVQDQCFGGDARVCWALGWHVDDGAEILGAWCQTEPIDPPFVAAMADLRSRGVERITTLISDDVFAVKTPASSRDQRRHRAAPAVLEVAQMAKLSTARPALRRMLLAAEQQAQGIEKRLLRAVARNGVLVDDAAALEFVAAHLMRAEQKFDQESVDGLASFRSTAFAVSPVARQ